MEYTFCLKFQLSDADHEIDQVVERLGEAGCHDALVGIGLPGRVALQFVRESTDAETAVRRALEDARHALPTARLIEVTPDFVGLTDIADVLGVSRQYMRKLMLAHPGRFPAPVHAGTASIWHLADVLDWLQDEAGYPVSRESIDVARVAWRVNVARDARRAGRAVSRELQSLAG